MNILITGIAGFIGSHTAEALLKEKHSIIGIDNFNDYYNPKFKEENIARFPFTVYRGDIRDAEILNKIFTSHSIEAVIHLAAMVGVRPSIMHPALYVDVNITGTLNVLACAQKYGVKKFIFASSSSVYGNRDTVPFTETDPTNSPISPYAATKKSGELLCYAYHTLYQIPTVCLRFFTVYGPRGRPDMAPYKFTENIFYDKPIEIYGDGTAQRDFTYVTDIVWGVVQSLNITDGYHIINLGNSQPEPVRKLIASIEKNLGKKARIINKPPQPGDVHRTYANISQARKLLGYHPAVSLDDGIRQFCQWYISSRVQSS